MGRYPWGGEGGPSMGRSRGQYWEAGVAGGRAVWGNPGGVDGIMGRPMEGGHSVGRCYWGP